MSGGKTKRFRSMPLTFTLLMGTVIAACSNSGGADDSKKNTETVAPGATPTSEASAKANQPRTKLKMFMGDSGIPHPDGTDPSDNPFIRIVEDYANVDLDMDVPSYQDFQTKFNLLLSSGQLPDIVHTWFIEETDQRAREGAFIDLKKYYDSSPQVQKYVTPEMMELAKDKVSGNYWRIPMASQNTPQGAGIVARYDLVMKYNNNKWPETIEEWVNMMRTMKKAEPDSIILSNRVSGDYTLSYGGTPIFNLFGAAPYTYRVDGGKAVSTFTLPEYRAAVELYKQLYDEGIVDKEFAVNDNAKYYEKVKNKNVLWEYNSADQYVPSGVAKKPEDQTKEWLWAPPLKTYPSVVKDAKYTRPYRWMPIAGHGVYISAKSKDPERAWKAIEGFASDELHEAIFWGKEGETYNVKDGKRVPIAEKLSDKSRSWSLHLAFIFGFADGMDVTKAQAEMVRDPKELERMSGAMEMLNDQAMETGIGLDNFIVLSDEAAKKRPDEVKFISKATVEAIMGKITMQEFDQRVQEFQKKFGFIYDEYTKYLTEHKNELLKAGVKEAGW